MNEKATKRNSNIELLRIILILIIIMHHLIVHGVNLKLMKNGQLEMNNINIQAMFINTFIIIGVNVFIFISGYYGIKFKIIKLIKLIGEMIFYSLIINLIFIISGINELNLKMIISSLLPIKIWWFLTCYIILLVVSPYLNIIIDNSNKIEQYILILILTVIICVFGTTGVLPNIVPYSDGYNLWNCIYIYLLARVLRQNLKLESVKLSIFGYLISSIINFIIIVFAWKYINSQFAWRLLGYNNPLIIIASVFFFYIFKNIKLKNSKLINAIAKSTLGIYMIHEHPLVRKWMYDYLKIAESLVDKNLISILLYNTVFIFVVSFMFDKGKNLVFYYISKLSVLKSFIDKFNNNYFINW